MGAPGTVQTALRMDGDRPPSETEITRTIGGLLATAHDGDS
jgi:hypothetical protein